QSGGYKGLYEYVMSIDQKEVQSILNPLLQRIIPLYQQNSLSKENEDFWAARAALTFCKDTKIDRGIFSIYFFNLIHLKKGEGVYQPEGMPHAYLEGQNVEVMANSDNVLRAGLTEKHIDTKELMKHVNFTETQPGILKPDQNTNHIVFSSPAEEFELHQYQMHEKNVLEVRSRTGEIWLMYEGAASLKNKHTSMSLNKGEAIFLLPGQIVEVKNNYHCVLFRVTVPD
ncbi:MAG: mannose-6-phosphate isomerase, class I, partial [Flavisolibacter sp.]